MKRLLLLLLGVLTCIHILAKDVTYNASDCGYTSNTSLDNVSFTTSDGQITFTFAKNSGSNAPMYYSSSKNFRIYGDNTLKFQGANGVTITKIAFTQTENSWATTAPSTGSFTTNQTKSAIWEGSTNSVTFTPTSKIFITKIVITYSTSGSTQDYCTLTFDPESGSVDSGTTISITSTTEGATISWESTDGQSGKGSSPQTVKITKACKITASVSADGYETTTGEASYRLTGELAGTKYVPVTSQSDIAEGVNYILVGFKSETPYLMASKAKNSSDKNINALSEDAAVFEYNATNNYFDVVSTDDVAILTLEASSGKFKIKNGSYYLTGGYNSGNNYAKYDTSGNDATITYSTDGNGEITLLFDQSVTNGRNVFQYNSASTLFSCYSSASQSPVFLYMEDGSTPAAKAAAPTFSLEDTEALVYGTTYSVSISSGEKDSSFIYYSTDGGSNWSYDFTPVTVDVADDKSISAYAVLFDANTLDPIADSKSNTVTKNYIFQACSLTVEPAGGTVPENQPVTITATPDDATITWIYDDGGEGQMDEGTGTQTLTLTADGELTVEVTKDGYKKAEGTYTYTVTHICAEPTFSVSLDEGQGYATVAKGAKVTISSTTQGATIKWRLDEADEWTIGNEVEVTDDCTIYVLVEKEGYTSATGSIVVKVQQLAAPTFSPEGQRFDEGTTLKVEITSIEGATIHYTTDGTTYNEAESPATLYITTTTTVTAYATHAEWKDSPEATATYMARVPGSSLEFELVTDTKDITVDDQYIIVYSESSTTHTPGAVDSNCLEDVAGKVTITDDVATFSSDDEVNIFVLEANTDESTSTSYPFFVKESLGGKYISYSTSGTSLKTVTEGTAHSVSLNSDGNVLVVPSAAPTRSLRHSTGWRYYGNDNYGNPNGNFPKLYKKVGSATSCKTVISDYADGAYARGTEITFSTRTEGATIHYQVKLDGETEYGEESTTLPFVLAEACTVKAWATCDGLSNSDDAYFNYTIAQLATPEISVASGTKVADGASVTITAIEGSTIYYSIDGGTTYTQVDPVADAETMATVTLNAADFTNPSNAVVTYYATHPNYLQSATTEATYQIFIPKNYYKVDFIKTNVDYVVVGEVKSWNSKYLMVDGFTGVSESTGNFSFTNNDLILQNGNDEIKTIRFVEKDASQNQYYVMDGSNYVYGTTRNLNSNPNVEYNTVTFDSDGYAIIQYGEESKNHLQLNSQSMAFKYYSSDQSPIYLYLDEDEVTFTMPAVFSQEGGFIIKGNTISISCATEDAYIVYSIDGGGEIQALASVEIPIDADCTITAYTKKSGLTASTPVTYSFTVVDTEAASRYFKRIGSIDEGKAGIAAGKQFIFGAYSRFYMSNEKAARPALMSCAERTASATEFRLWAAPKQNATLGITNFALVGEEDGKIDDGDDEIEVFNNGIMALRNSEASSDNEGFAELAFVTIEQISSEGVKDYDNKDMSDKELFALKINGKYLDARTGSGNTNNVLMWSDNPAPVLLEMIEDLSEIPEEADYLVDRILCQWIKTVDTSSGDTHTYKCLEYNYSGDLNAFSGYQHTVSGIQQVYPFLYVEEDKTEVVTEIPDIEAKYRSATSEAVRKSEGNVGSIQYDNAHPEKSIVPTVTFDLPSRATKTETGKRPKATVTDFDPDKDVVIVAIVKEHGKFEGNTRIFKSEVGKALTVPLYVDSDVYAYSMLDGYSTTKSGNSATYYLSVDDPTGIVEVGVDEIEQGARVFNLQGQLLPRPVKGQVVIVAPQGGRAYKALLK